MSQEDVIFISELRFHFRKCWTDKTSPAFLNS